VDWDVRWSGNAEPDFVTPDIDNRDYDVVTDKNAFISLT